MLNTLLVIHLLVAIGLVCVVLMQRTAQDGGGLTGGSSTMGGLFTARGSANLLTRSTAILATIFIVSSLVLSILASGSGKGKSRVEQLATQTQQQDNALQADKAGTQNDKPAVEDKLVNPDLNKSSEIAAPASASKSEGKTGVNDNHTPKTKNVGHGKTSKSAEQPMNMGAENANDESEDAPEVPVSR